MALYALRRRGTTPGFWRGYNSAQTLLAERTMKSVPPGFRKETSSPSRSQSSRRHGGQPGLRLESSPERPDGGVHT